MISSPSSSSILSLRSLSDRVPPARAASSLSAGPAEAAAASPPPVAFFGAGLLKAGLEALPPAVARVDCKTVRVPSTDSPWVWKLE